MNSGHRLGKQELLSPELLSSPDAPFMRAREEEQALALGILGWMEQGGGESGELCPGKAICPLASDLVCLVPSHAE